MTNPFEMKKDTYYFQHDYNAANDVKCLFLRQQLGMEGYGIFWFLIESLANAGGSLPLSITPVLAMQMQVTEAKVKAVITSFNLFEIFDDSFVSVRLNEHLNFRKVLSDKGREGVRKRWANREALPEAITEANSHPISSPNTKERKGNKRKVKNTQPEPTAPGAGEAFTDPDAEKFSQFQDWISRYAPNVAGMQEPFTIDQYRQLRGKYNQATVQKLLMEMHNWKSLKKTNVSAYLTLVNWASRRSLENDKTPSDGTKISKREQEDKALLEAAGI
jgi:hypothetical protein